MSVDVTPGLGELQKLDRKAADGLSGVYGSIAHTVNEIEEHLHSPARWLGKSADQSGDDWAADNLTPFQAISGNGDYGSDADDEAKVLGPDDTPLFNGSAYFDMHRMLVSGASSTTPYKLRIIYGTGTMADAITAGQYSEVMFTIVASSRRTPIELQMDRVAVGSKVWVQAKNATDDATADFFVEVHEYEG